MNKTKDEYVNKLNVIFEDNHIIVVEKYINVLSQKDITEDIDMTEIIKAYLKSKYQKPGNIYLGLVHRLDRRVGGVMVFAKTSKAAKRISEDIRNNHFDKQYLCCVKGVLSRDGEINLKLKKDEITKLASVANDGKESSLKYKVISTVNNMTYVLVNLITGRYNQIRISFAYIGNPIINDHKYGKTIPIKKNDLGLWCFKLGFNHPVSKEYLQFKLLPKGEIWESISDKIKKL